MDQRATDDLSAVQSALDEGNEERALALLQRAARGAKRRGDYEALARFAAAADEIGGRGAALAARIRALAGLPEPEQPGEQIVRAAELPTDESGMPVLRHGTPVAIGFASSGRATNASPSLCEVPLDSPYGGFVLLEATPEV